MLLKIVTLFISPLNELHALSFYKPLTCDNLLGGGGIPCSYVHIKISSPSAIQNLMKITCDHEKLYYMPKKLLPAIVGGVEIWGGGGGGAGSSGSAYA